MMGMKEGAVPDLDKVKSRALKTLAMGRIDQADCDLVVSKVDDLIGIILNMHEEEKE